MRTPPMPRKENANFQAASDATEKGLCNNEVAETNEKQADKQNWKWDAMVKKLRPEEEATT